MSEDLSVPMDEQAIGGLINRLRDDKGISGSTLAQRVGLSQAQVSRLENGKQGFRSARLRAIADALGYDAMVVFIPRTKNTRPII